MPFDFGWDFRDTLAFVTDPTYSAYARDETYPHTYTNGDGKTVNAGFEVTMGGAQDLSAVGMDPVIAGDTYIGFGGGATTFRVDLSSGSALGSGTYTTNFALGAAGSGRQFNLIALNDSGTALIGPSGHIDTAASFIDSSLSVIPQPALPATWDSVSATTTVTFATTTCTLGFQANAPGDFASIAFFRLTFISGGGGGGGAGACECSFFHSFDYREVSDFMDCVVGRRS